MTDKLEEVALAMIAVMEAGGATIDVDGDLSSVKVRGWFDLDAVAKAAIETMREPTDAMVDAAVSILLEAWNLNGLESFAGNRRNVVVRAMLRKAADAALEGKK